MTLDIKVDVLKLFEVNKAKDNLSNLAARLGAPGPNEWTEIFSKVKFK